MQEMPSSSQGCGVHSQAEANKNAELSSEESDLLSILKKTMSGKRSV